MNERIKEKIIKTKNIKLKIKLHFLLQKNQEQNEIKEILATISEKDLF